MARASWLEPIPAPVPPPPTYAYPTYQYAPMPMVGGQVDYGASWVAEGPWVEPWPTYEAVVADT
eukprot:8540859-Lingulodinium_polyedra.AAC.1